MIPAFLELGVCASCDDLSRWLCEDGLCLKLSRHSVFIAMTGIRRRGGKRDIRNEAKRRE